MLKFNRLSKKFYHQDTFKIAKDLLGKFLIRKIGSKTLIAKIVETEAYYGFNDKASHASRGKTARTITMFGHPGTAYIYLIYGIYNCLNIVTEAKEFPAAVLIRAVEPSFAFRATDGRPINFKKETNGPGKLCRELKIDKKLNNENLITSTKLYLAENSKEKIKSCQIKKAKRIGVDYAEKYKDKLWRYYLKDNPFVSKR